MSDQGLRHFRWSHNYSHLEYNVLKRLKLPFKKSYFNLIFYLITILQIIFKINNKHE